MKALLIFALVLVGCGGSRLNETYCGMRLAEQQKTYQYQHWTLRDLQDAEDHAVLAFEKLVINDRRFQDTCLLLDQTTVVVRPEKTWYNLDGIEVAGETPCAIKTIFTNGVDGTEWYTGSVVHEMAHIVQNCDPRQPHIITDITSPKFYHQHWLEDKIYGSIDEANQAKKAKSP